MTKDLTVVEQKEVPFYDDELINNRDEENFNLFPPEWVES